MKEFYQMAEGLKKEIKEKIKAFLKEQKEISFVYVFGSFLESEPIAFQDIDIGIYLNPLEINQSQSFNYETDLAIKLSRILDFPADHLDPKILNFAPKSFQNNVFSRGELLFAKNSDLLTDLIEKTSEEAVVDYEFSKQSLMELIS